MEKYDIGLYQFFLYGKPLLKKMTYHGKPAGYCMRLALTNKGSIHNELIQPVAGEKVYSDFVKPHGNGVHHIGVLVNDMESALAEARTAGFEMTMDGVGFGTDGDGQYAYLDTEAILGITLELIQRPKNRVKPKKFTWKKKRNNTYSLKHIPLVLQPEQEYLFFIDW